MIDLLVLTLAGTAACAAPGVPVVERAAADSALERTYNSGVAFASFLDNAKQRAEQWRSNYEKAVVPDALLARARAVGGSWKLLVVAVDGCSDSVNTVPYVARLVEELEGVELRVVDNEVGKAIMESHRTPDGRAATPTILLLDANYVERGCFIERPAELRSWMSGEKSRSGDSGLFAGKMKWYDDDKGVHTMEEIVAAMEAAARGEAVCR